MLNIQFIVKAKTGPKQEVRIVGSLLQLGQWNPQKGLKLYHLSEEQWESQDPIEVAQNSKFQFKLVKVKENGQIEWEKLPNNSNRKFKPKYHSKLIILWGSGDGKVVNQSKRSYKIQGLPAAIIKNRKNLKRSSLFDPLVKASQYDSQVQDGDVQNCFKKKTTVDSLVKINIQDIQEMYYDTTQVEMTYGQTKKPKVYIISKNLNLVDNKFHLKIAQQVEQLEEILNITWFYCSLKGQIRQTKKRQFHQLPEIVLKSGKLLNQQLSILNDQSGFFIFLDLFISKNVEVKDLKSCLFLKDQQFQQVEKNIEYFKQFKLIAFDHHRKNEEFFLFLKARKSLIQIQQFDYQPATPKINQNKNDAITLQNLLQQLHIQEVGKAVNVNTVYSISQKQALDKILQPNSILILDCALKEENNQFFQKLISQNIQKRMIIIVASDKCPEPIKQYIQRKDIVIISGNYQKIKMKEKVHQPMKKHLQIINFLEMKAKLFISLYGGQASFDQKSISYKNNEEPQILDKIQIQLKDILKDMNYFKVIQKQNKIKVTWYLAPKIRLIRTLCRVKYLSEGKVGNFQLVSVQQNFQELKNQIKMLVQLRTFFLQNASNTKVEHFSYGNKIQAKYTIIPSSQKILRSRDFNRVAHQKK